MLATTPPARGPQFTASPQGTDHVTTEADGLVVTVRLRPNRPGSNLAMVDIISTRRPAPGSVRSASLALGPSAAVWLTPQTVDADGNGRWQSLVELPAGDVAIRLTIARPGQPDSVTTGSWATEPTRPVDVIVSRQPLATSADAAAAAAVLLALVGAVVLWRRRPVARAAVTDLLSGRDQNFRVTAERVLEKYSELYRRLA